MFSVISSPGSNEWSAFPPTLTEAGCHCGQSSGVVMKSKTCSIGRRISMLLQMRVIESFPANSCYQSVLIRLTHFSIYARRARSFLHLFAEPDVSHGAESSHDRLRSS